MPDKRLARRSVTAAGVLLLAVLLAGCTPGRTATTTRHTPGPAAREAAPRANRPSPVSMPSGRAARFTVARRTSAGPVLLTRLKGAKSGVTGKVWVWLPPQYHDPRYATTGFPVIILHTGGSGAGYNYWGDPEVLPTLAEDVRLAKAGKAYPFIMVMPVLQLSERLDTECSDIPRQPKMGTWMAEDVPAFIRANFRTLSGRDGWGIAGASSGAFCAVKLAADHPERYKAVVSWGGYFAPQTDLPWPANDRRANSPDLILQRSRPDIRLLLLVGDNPRFRGDILRMNALLRMIHPPTVASTYVQPHGGHYTADLSRLIPRILRFLTDNMQGPQAA